MIKGISDIRRLPRLGCIRLGIKLKTEKGVEYPKEVDYFILDPTTPDELEKEEYISQFKHLFGEQPKTIEIMFPVDDINVFFPQFYKRYGSSTDLKCYGDNETAICLEDKFAEGLTKVGETERGRTKVECRGDKCIHVDKKKPECGMVGSLMVLIPKISMSGVWQITTRSFNSIVNINSSIALASDSGRKQIRMRPAKLQRRPRQTKYDGKKSTHYILHLNIDNLQSPQIVPGENRLELAEADASVEAVAIRGDAVKPDAFSSEDGVDKTAEQKECESFSEGEDLSQPHDEEKEGVSAPAKKHELSQEVKALTFWEFMPQARAKLKKSGMENLYTESLQAYHVEVLSDLKNDEMKQREVRILVEAEMEDHNIEW